jgi:hypothetical protein
MPPIRATGTNAATSASEIQFGMVKLVTSFTAATITRAGKMAVSRPVDVMGASHGKMTGS